MADQFAPEPVKGVKSHNTATPDIIGDQVPVISAIATAVAPTLTEGYEVKQSVNLKGETRVVQDVELGAGNVTAKTQRVTIAADDIVTVSANEVANTATNPIFQQETNGTAVAAFGSGVITPATKRVTIATDNIVRVSATDTANLVTNPIFVRLSDGVDPLGTALKPIYVTMDGNPGDPFFTTAKTTATAAGASGTLQGTIIAAGKNGMLQQVVVSASVRFKAVIQRNDGGTVSDVAVLFGGASDTKVFEPKDRDTFKVTGSATSRYQVVMTNLDNSYAADLYATIEWNEVTP